MKQIFIFLIGLLLSLTTVSQTVYRTPSGKKYHLSTCHMVKNVSASLSLVEAAEQGLEPCKICNPSTAATTPTSPKPVQGKSQTIQCHGMTKAGTRCRHMTSIGNGYCYQHQPK